jgi:hypothetical protein
MARLHTNETSAYLDAALWRARRLNHPDNYFMKIGEPMRALTRASSDQPPRSSIDGAGDLHLAR